MNPHTNIDDIDTRKKALKEQMASLEIERLKLQGKYGVCSHCGEEKQLVNTELFVGVNKGTCYSCDEKRRQRETDEFYSKFIGTKIVKINAESRHVYSVSPTIFSIELEGGYEITVKAYSDPHGMEIESLGCDG